MPSIFRLPEGGSGGNVGASSGPAAIELPYVVGSNGLSLATQVQPETAARNQMSGKMSEGRTVLDTPLSIWNVLD